jgi:hypothetical protein
MKLRFLVSTFALALTTIVAHAQTGLYLNPIITRASNTVADTGSFAFLGQNSKSAIFGGVDIGAYYMFAHYTGFDVGVDVREVIQHANNAGLSSFMVAPRIAFKPVSYGLKPYAQVGFGAGRTHSGENSAHVTKLELAVTGGIDKPLGRYVDWRVVEVGYGSVSTISSAVYNGPTPVPAAKLLNFSAGLVFKIP